MRRLTTLKQIDRLTSLPWFAPRGVARACSEYWSTTCGVAWSYRRGARHNAATVTILTDPGLPLHHLRNTSREGCNRQAKRGPGRWPKRGPPRWVDGSPLFVVVVMGMGARGKGVNNLPVCG